MLVFSMVLFLSSGRSVVCEDGGTDIGWRPADKDVGDVDLAVVTHFRFHGFKPTGERVFEAVVFAGVFDEAFQAFPDHVRHLNVGCALCEVDVGIVLPVVLNGAWLPSAAKGVGGDSPYLVCLERTAFCRHWRRSLLG